MVQDCNISCAVIVCRSCAITLKSKYNNKTGQTPISDVRNGNEMRMRMKGK